MILEGETYEQFGYYPSDLKPKSAKHILAACDECGKVRVITKNKYRALCGSCAQRGRHPSEETRKKISDALKGEKSPLFGKHLSEEEKKRRREATTKQWQDPKHRKKVSETIRKMWQDPELIKMRRTLSIAMWQDTEHIKKMKRLHQDHKYREKLSNAGKKNWQDSEYIKMMMEARKKSPNKAEVFLDMILQKHRPNEWAFNGNFEEGVSLGRLIPDFVNVNGKKVVIEVFGEPFHDTEMARKVLKRSIRWNKTEFGRKAVYSQLGYKCIVFWYLDLMRLDAEVFILKTLEREGW